MSLFNFLKEPKPSLTKIEDPQQIKKKYKFWRLSIFLCLYVVYFVSYLARKDLSVATPGMCKSWNITNTQIGYMLVAAYISYGIGKFVNGMLSDRSNLKIMLPLTSALGAVLGGLIPICGIFADNKTLLVTSLVITWGLTGWFQSFAFPLCGKALTFWFADKERSSWWSYWSTSHEIGGASAALILLPFVTMFSWEYAFYIPAIISVIVAVIAFFGLQDKPVTIGLPDVEEYHHTPKTEIEEKEDIEAKTSYSKLIVKYILGNKDMWFLGLAFFFVYIVRFGPMDWFIKIFKDLGFNMKTSVLYASITPIAGMIGTLSIPIVSNKIFKGRRAPANFAYLMLAALSLVGVVCILGGNTGQAVGGGYLTNTEIVWLFIFMALLGIGTCGPLVLIGGLCSIESSSKRVAAASTGFTGALGYAGASFVGLGTGMLMDASSWFAEHGILHAEIWFWAIAGLLGALCCIPLWNKGSFNSESSH